MSREYTLHEAEGKPRPNRGGVVVERRGKSLKRIRTLAPRPKLERLPFGGRRNEGRKPTEGWTDRIRRTVRELLDLYEDIWLSVIHIRLPAGTTGKQAKAVFARLHRWLHRQGIAALCIAETPNPHFHAAVAIDHSREKEQELRRLISKWWNEVFHSLPAESSLEWRRREEPTEAIKKYLSKSSKEERGVKGKMPWLTFLPYFLTNLPQRIPEQFQITEEEADAVLHPHYSSTFGAAEALDALRKSQNGRSETSLLRQPESEEENGVNPAATATCVAVATDTGELSELLALSPVALRGENMKECFGLCRALDYRLLSLRLDGGALEWARRLHGFGQLQLVCTPESGSILHMLVSDSADLPPHLRVQLQPGTSVPREFEVIYLAA